MIKYILIFVFPFFFLSAYADWPIGRGRSLLGVSFSTYYTNKYFDSSHKLSSFANPNDRFTSYSVGFNFVHGIYRFVDFVGDCPFVYLISVSNGIQSTKTSPGDARFGIAIHFPTNKLKNFLSIKGMVIVPTYHNTALPYVGYGNKGYFVASSYSFSPAYHTFCALESFYSKYFPGDGTGPIQYGYNLAFGFVFGRYNSIVGNVTGIYSESISKGFTTNINSNKDFDYTKASLTFSKRITRTMGFNVQGSYTINGKNAGQGLGLSLSLNTRFP